MKNKTLIEIILLTIIFAAIGYAQPTGNIAAVVRPLSNTSASAAPARKNVGCINFTIKNIKTSQGTFYLARYREPETFLKKGKESFSKPVMPAGGATQKAEMCDLEAGWYAVAAMQDLDNDGDMKFNFLGMPREPYGFSNAIHPHFKAPNFRQCSFYIEPGKELVIDIDMINP